MRTERFPRVLSALLGLLLLQACVNPGTRPLDERDVPDRQWLNIGVTPNYPPLVFRDGEDVRGIEADLARAVTSAMGVSYSFVEMPWDRLIPELRAGRIDVIMSGMSMTPEREGQVLFADSYLRVGQMALIRKEDIRRLGAPGTLYRPGLRIGVEAGTTGAAFVEDDLAGAIAVPFETPDDAAAALREGKIEVFIHDAPTIWRLGTDGDPGGPDLIGLYTPLTREDLAWAVRQGDDALRDRLNRQLKVLRESGRLKRILDRWMTTRIEIGAGGILR